MAALAIDSSLALPRSQYVRRETAKDLVVLHHTAGGSASSSVAWWRQTRARIATAYVVGRDGTVYECFDPDYWASHLGVGGSIERRSIGIELANWGPLRYRGRTPVNWAGRAVDCDVVEHAWRGERYWEAYPEPQLQAAFALTRQLVARYGIDPDVAPAQLGAPDTRRFRRFRGVIAHHHVRADKTDVHPGFPWERLAAAIEGRQQSEREPVPDTDPVYVVRSGDTLWSIAQRYGKTVDGLAEVNGFAGSRIVPGQRLRVA